MPIPHYQSIMLALLKYAGNGQDYVFKDTIEALADEFQLTAEERVERVPGGRQASFENRVVWARTYMQKAGLLVVPEKGIFSITPKGQRVLEQSPDSIDVPLLEKLDGLGPPRKVRRKTDKSEEDIEAEAASRQAKIDSISPLVQADSLDGDPLQTRASGQGNGASGLRAGIEAVMKARRRRREVPDDSAEPAAVAMAREPDSPDYRDSDVPDATGAAIPDDGADNAASRDGDGPASTERAGYSTNPDFVDPVMDDAPVERRASARRQANGAQRFSESIEASLRELDIRLEAELPIRLMRAPAGVFRSLILELAQTLGLGEPMLNTGPPIVIKSGFETVLQQDELGLEMVYLWASRSKRITDLAQLQRCAGALQGHHAHKGILFSVAGFDAEAREYAAHLGNRMILVDGRNLAAMMVRHNVGIQATAFYEIKDLDPNYFP